MITYLLLLLPLLLLLWEVANCLMASTTRFKLNRDVHM
jgi:hypothetical protein